MCWDVDIVHRANDFLVDADYWSRLSADLCYDPTFREYLHFVSSFRSMHPPPTDIPMQPENMPYYRGPRVKYPGNSKQTVNVAANSLLAMIVTQERFSPPCLANYPVQFGRFPGDQVYDTNTRALYNSEYPALAFHASRFSWAVYSFNSGHFVSMILMRNLPFDIILACNPHAHGRALFDEFTTCPCILPSASALLDHIRGSGNQSLIDGYLIHSHRYQTSAPTTAFWAIQTLIVIQLQAIRRLQAFIACVHPDHDSRSVSKFVTQLDLAGNVGDMSATCRRRVDLSQILARHVCRVRHKIAKNFNRHQILCRQPPY